jgi:hypothetical protein
MLASDSESGWVGAILQSIPSLQSSSSAIWDSSASLTGLAAAQNSSNRTCGERFRGLATPTQQRDRRASWWSHRLPHRAPGGGGGGGGVTRAWGPSTTSGTRGHDVPDVVQGPHARVTPPPPPGARCRSRWERVGGAGGTHHAVFAAVGTGRLGPRAAQIKGDLVHILLGLTRLLGRRQTVVKRRAPRGVIRACLAESRASSDTGLRECACAYQCAVLALVELCKRRVERPPDLHHGGGHM